MWEAHAILGHVVTLFTLALAVTVRAALLLHHLVAAAHTATHTLVDVVPQLRVGTSRTWYAHTFLHHRAA